jgi:(p)ppGpp synthase/HD superfamily hydrolase
MNLFHILDDIELERERRLLGLLQPDPYALILFARAKASLQNEIESSRLDEAFKFAKEIQYRHIGLKSDIYFSHPIRVSALATLISATQHSEIGVLAVLHNVLEVSDVTFEKLASTFGIEIASQIDVLTVDRSLQWEKAYKSRYYRNLMDGPMAARIVKIVDKLDNLFVLGINPDAELREWYLAEIEDFVIPMVMKSLPKLTAYMMALVQDCRLTGFIELPLSNIQKEKI